jgi:hypothetical protein
LCNIRIYVRLRDEEDIPEMHCETHHALLTKAPFWDFPHLGTFITLYSSESCKNRTTLPENDNVQ